MTGAAPNRQVARVGGPCCTCSTPSGFRVGDLVLRRVSTNLARRLMSLFAHRSLEVVFQPSLVAVLLDHLELRHISV